MKLVIIEGTDQLGKSTVVNHLKKNFDLNGGAIILHESTPIYPNQHFSDFFSSLKDSSFYEKCIEYNTMKLCGIKSAEKALLELNQATIIADRLHLSEYVYGEVYRPQLLKRYFRGNPIGSLLEFESWIKDNFEVFQIVFTTDKNFEYRDDNGNYKHQAATLKRVNAFYQLALDWTSLNTLNIEVKSPDSSNSSKILDWISKSNKK